MGYRELINQALSDNQVKYLDANNQPTEDIVGLKSLDERSEKLKELDWDDVIGKALKEFRGNAGNDARLEGTALLTRLVQTLASYRNTENSKDAAVKASYLNDVIAPAIQNIPEERRVALFTRFSEISN
jgi:hypothetical protein